MAAREAADHDLKRPQCSDFVGYVTIHTRSSAAYLVQRKPFEHTSSFEVRENILLSNSILSLDCLALGLRANFDITSERLRAN